MSFRESSVNPDDENKYVEFLLQIDEYLNEYSDKCRTQLVSASGEEKQFLKGKQFAYYEVLSLLAEEAAHWGLSIPGFPRRPPEAVLSQQPPDCGS
jgi:hypothetical protein